MKIFFTTHLREKKKNPNSYLPIKDSKLYLYFLIISVPFRRHHSQHNWLLSSSVSLVFILSLIVVMTKIIFCHKIFYCRKR